MLYILLKFKDIGNFLDKLLGNHSTCRRDVTEYRVLDNIKEPGTGHIMSLIETSSFV